MYFGQLRQWQLIKALKNRKVSEKATKQAAGRCFHFFFVFVSEPSKSLKLGIDSLDELVTVHKKIGSGTFSSVFLASLRGEDSKKLAIKRLIPTSNPKRIEQELKCLMTIGGSDNVGGIEACVRQRELVAFVMPFCPHDKFHDYFDKMDVAETRLYMKNLLIALRRVHSFNIIHRDVKPSNFLYNRAKGEWLLVDFGLAQEVKALPTTTTTTTSNKRTVEPQEENHPPKRIRLEVPQEKSEGKPTQPPATLQFKSPLKQNHSNNIPPPLAIGVKSTCLGLSMNFRMMDRRKTTAPLCFCYGKSQVCNICIVKREMQASRAGTPGYRPPEVLLKYPHQTTAVDIWAAGMIFLSILAKAYPFFRAHDDFMALAEMITIFGDKRFKQLAMSMERHIKVGRKRPATNLRKLCVLLRRRESLQLTANAAADCMYCHHQLEYCLCKQDQPDNDEFSDAAYDLLLKMLELDPRKRITADDALNHPFFNETSSTTSAPVKST